MGILEEIDVPGWQPVSGDKISNARTGKYLDEHFVAMFICWTTSSSMQSETCNTRLR